MCSVVKFEPLMVYQWGTEYQKGTLFFNAKTCKGFEPNVHSDSRRLCLETYPQICDLAEGPVREFPGFSRKGTYRSVFSGKSPYGSLEKKAKGPDSPVDCQCPSTAEPSAGRQARSGCKNPWWCTNERQSIKKETRAGYSRILRWLVDCSYCNICSNNCMHMIY